MGLDIHDGYGQTETGQLTGMPAGEPMRAGSMGRPLPGFGLDVVDEDGRPAYEGELTLDPSTVPTFFRGYLGEPAVRASRCGGPATACGATMTASCGSRAAWTT